ncbi:hypothetical protein ACFUTX_05750 [Microbacterium sp. NPDC057407]|uniref:hypothetical protein n=1 Tax=Microbacterium sp. NPDC057407 TaxID=3346120 RepID=UPI00366C140B
MTSTHRWPAALSALLALALTGCAPPAAPDPEPAFATEAEAFAAAEKTYRAYVDALNEVDLSDPETFEAVYAWTTGDANAEARETFSRMHADNWNVSGTSTVTAVELEDVSDRMVRLAVCLDVSKVLLLDHSRQSAVSEDRPDIQSMLITLQASKSRGSDLLISDFAGREGEPKCA